MQRQLDAQAEKVGKTRTTEDEPQPVAPEAGARRGEGADLPVEDDLPEVGSSGRR